uniref:Phospholipase A2 n=2 Tax=Leptobrachium leishanense TaxID=445787 RepID=A0A8C5Q807_9ANUR
MKQLRAILAAHSAEDLGVSWTAQRMASSWYILALLFVAVAITQCNIWDFARMIKKVTRKSALSYIAYGCYCGYGGSGQPKDLTDWCCHKHDCCYDHLDQIGCHPMFKSYKFEFVNEIMCEHDEDDYCASKTCECDRETALCFKANRATYSYKYFLYMKKVMCKDPAVHCSMYTF